MKRPRSASGSSSSKRAHVDEVPFPDAPNSAHRERCTTQRVQGRGVQTASAPQDTQSKEEEKQINLPDWFENLFDFGNELLKPCSQSGEGVSHGVGRVPRAGAALCRTDPQRHAAPCIAPVKASREADAENAQAPPPALPQPLWRPGATQPIGR
ncbi:uncharacterized protein LOC126284546 isoform X2 [Schistocerca gregaria]|uniref:uncharacterized protein LOC126284546 isoform X2 n=1 Tax=Schistocerca gregaria TaxID=7010 RepID=UPI00211DD89D|nr:uncharacterized protein LOC126284546 isoform X2 [Schistocerca gregaria]